jgi:hypothetical protein
MPSAPLMTLGHVPPAVYRRALWLPALVLLASFALVARTGKADWLGVGGAIVAAIGTRRWAARLFRVGPKKSDEQVPSPTLPMEAGARGVAVNPDFFNTLQRQALDNLSSYIGVWLTIAGGLLGGAGPFLLKLLLP